LRRSAAVEQYIARMVAGLNHFKAAGGPGAGDKK
jgi:hypothetical protein